MVSGCVDTGRAVRSAHAEGLQQCWAATHPLERGADYGQRHALPAHPRQPHRARVCAMDGCRARLRADSLGCW